MSDEPELRDLINAQTAQIGWQELQRHFARGVMICVAPELDLVAVAERMINDDKTQIEHWMNEGQLRNAELQDARQWQHDQTQFWAVTSPPWVLVQEIKA